MTAPNQVSVNLEAVLENMKLQHGEEHPYCAAMRSAIEEINVLSHTVEASTLLALRAASQSVLDREVKDGLQAENSRLHNQMVAMGGPELREYINLFELRWKADMRAIERWQKAHPGNENVWPDHTDLVTWLMEEIGDGYHGPQ